MNHIDRLLIKVKKTAKGLIRHILGRIEYREALQKFTVSGILWDGISGTAGDKFYSEHGTRQEAELAFGELNETHPNAESICIVIDYGDSEDAAN